jgi:hypothetical protein
VALWLDSAPFQQTENFRRHASRTGGLFAAQQEVDDDLPSGVAGAEVPECVRDSVEAGETAVDHRTDRSVVNQAGEQFEVGSVDSCDEEGGRAAAQVAAKQMDGPTNEPSTTV